MCAHACAWACWCEIHLRGKHEAGIRKLPLERELAKTMNLHSFKYQHTHIDSSHIHTYIHTSIHTYIYPYIHVQSKAFANIPSMYARKMNQSTRACIGVDIHTYIHTYMQTYIGVKAPWSLPLPPALSPDLQTHPLYACVRVSIRQWNNFTCMSPLTPMAMWPCLWACKTDVLQEAYGYVHVYIHTYRHTNIHTYSKDIFVACTRLASPQASDTALRIIMCKHRYTCRLWLTWSSLGLRQLTQNHEKYANIGKHADCGSHEALLASAAWRNCWMRAGLRISIHLSTCAQTCHSEVCQDNIDYEQFQTHYNMTK
jgi:hypothetical protein